MLLRTMSILTLIFSFIFVSCSPKHSEIIVSKFGDKEIKMGEFETVYAKNAGSFEQAKKDSLSKLKSFLELYTNFQMKLRDAEVRGYAKDPSLNNELLDYKKKVGVTYILEKQLVEPAIKKYYERRKTELRVSHIMFAPDKNPDSAGKLASEVLDRIKKGEEYEDLCAKYSSDKFTKDLGGDIYFITAGMLTPGFDDACYNTPVGAVYPEVLHTQWGFHIIKVTEKRDRIPQIRASHIMAKFTDDNSVTDSIGAKKKIDSAYAALQAGKDFAETAKKFSNDSGSKENGGDLGFFERRRMIKEFDEAAFNLKLGEYSKPIMTQFGYHIIKATEFKPYPTFEADKEELKKIYKGVSYNADYDKMIEQLKTKYNFVLDGAVFTKVVTQNDSAKLTPEFYNTKFGKSIKGVNLFKLNGKDITVDSVFNTAMNNSELNNRLIDSTLMKSMLKTVVGEMALNEEAVNYDKVNPEFAALMDDYKNGIFIFKLQDEEVWGKIALDSAKLVNFYNATKKNYNMPDRVSFDEISVTGDSLKTLVYNLLKKGENFDSVAVKYSEKKTEEGKTYHYPLTEITGNDLAEAASRVKKVGDFTEPFQMNSGFSIVKLVTKEGPRPKTFEEAKAEVSGAFQEAEGKRLETEYLNQLIKIYKPVFNYDNLDKAFKSE